MRIAFITAAVILILALGVPGIVPQLFANGKDHQLQTSVGAHKGEKFSPRTDGEDDANEHRNKQMLNCNSTALAQQDEDGDDD